MNKKNVSRWLFGSMMLAVGAGCSSSDNDETAQKKGVKVVMPTITQVADDDTRAVLTYLADGTPAAEWAEGDEVTCF